MRTTLVAVTTALTIALSPTLGAATAQDTLPPEPSPPAVTAENAETLDEQQDDGQPTTRERAPDTDDCPHLESPATARTTSEAVAPGGRAPVVLPVPEVPAGGPLMASCGVIAPAGFTLPENQTASAWMVFDLDSGEILAAKDPHGRYRPASIIKALIGLIAIEQLDPAQKVTGTWDAANIEGSRVGVGEGGEYTVDELLHGLLLASGNDAAYLLAQELGGDEATLEMVNERAREIGTQDTFVATYSGLDAPGMSTSAYDMALIYQHAWENARFAEIVDTEFVDFPGWGDNEGFQVWNDNGLFMNDPDGIGGKTGYTDDANHTFVGALNREGRRIGAVILDTTIDKGRPWEQARELIDASLVTLPGEGVGQLGQPGEEENTTPTQRPEPSASPAPQAQDGQDTTALDIARVVLPISTIVVLLLAALAWTFGRRRRG
ncbi:D-alanyl-D-alanine carboxypeptidase family protein [Corynebacterium gallinarum]|uniref:D-alanyl-D-alanine carboxypeptidase family protein n=1 Tax=Corynebacterium gallinarum TaxID=2762214 RepID=UPI001CD89920|nr:D-alanyl-D-alanine carboxypeptidase family protein [Corynebacterium gallinarum]